MQSEKLYSLRVPLTAQLQPNTASIENITVYTSDTNEEIEILDAIYMPDLNEMSIDLAATSLSAATCIVNFNENVKYIGGATAAGNVDGLVQGNSQCEIFDIGVRSLIMYQDNMQVINPEISKQLIVKVKVVNASGNDENVKVALFIDRSDNEIEIQTQNLEIKASSEVEVEFELPDGLNEEMAGTICAYAEVI